MFSSRFAFTSLAAAALAEEEYDASGMLQAQRAVKRHQTARHLQVWEDKATEMMCIPVFTGDRAPIVGHFTADGLSKSEEVRVGQVAPTNGKFCVESGTMSLLQRSFGFNSGEEVEQALVRKGEPTENGVSGKTGDSVDGSVNGKDMSPPEPKFALTELGPFRLKQTAVELSIDQQTRTYTARDGTVSGAFALDQTPPLDTKGSNYWLGASEVDWAYQVIQTDNLEGSTSFEKFGGFILQGSAEATALEIDPTVSDPLMTMTFGEPFAITKSQWNSCTSHLVGGPMDGPAKITIPSLLEKGALEYCWETNHKECERGCFMYHTKYGYQGFAVLDFAMHSLGPFPLVSRTDLAEGSPARDDLMLSTAKTFQASTLTKGGSDFWLGAHEVDWAYQQNNEAMSGKSFEDYGGFLLVDTGGIVEKVLEIEIGATKPEMTLQFNEPHHVSETTWNQCMNPAKITIAALSTLGAQQYCWEVSSGKCERGCFIYKTTNGYQGFAVKTYALEKLGPFDLVERPDLLDGFAMNVDTNRYAFDEANLNGDSAGNLGTSAQVGTAAQTWWGASEVYWAYQMVSNPPAGTKSFEAYGGWVIRDENQSLKFYQIGGAAEGTPFKTLNFGSAFHITEAKWNGCVNPQPNDIELHAILGALEYCWEVDSERCDFGCFLYKTTTGFQGFPAKP